MNESHRHSVESRKPSNKKLILYVSIHLKLKVRQNESLMLEVRIVSSLEISNFKMFFLSEMLMTKCVDFMKIHLTFTYFSVKVLTSYNDIM